MMKVLVDNNVVLDAIVSREPFREAAESLILKVGTNELNGCITASSTTDIFYILKKMSGTAKAKQSLFWLFSTFDILAVDEMLCRQALALPLNDFEDALLVACALRAGVDAIISRDQEFIKNCKLVSILTPGDFLKNF
jgi:predicted nucleic acid-binding protein